MLLNSLQYYGMRRILMISITVVFNIPIIVNTSKDTPLTLNYTKLNISYIIFCNIYIFITLPIFSIFCKAYVNLWPVYNMLYVRYAFTLGNFCFIGLTGHSHQIFPNAPLVPAKVPEAIDSLTVSRRNTCQLLLFVSTAKAFLFQENLITFHKNSDKWWKTRPN